MLICVLGITFCGLSGITPKDRQTDKLTHTYTHGPKLIILFNNIGLGQVTIPNIKIAVRPCVSEKKNWNSVGRVSDFNWFSIGSDFQEVNL